MRALVTGGAGFIGSHSVDALLAEGHDVAVLDDLSTGRREFVNPKAAFFEMDIRTGPLADAFASFEPTHVLHLAAQMDVRLSLERPMFDAEINVLGTLRLLEQCVAHNIQAFVFSSTGGAIYGEPNDLPATETTPARPLCPYGASKLAGEQYIELFGRIHGLNYTILRYGNVYGPRQNPHGEAGVCAIFAGMMLENKKPTLYGQGDPVRDYVYVADVARANFAALAKPSGSALNIASGEGTSVKQLFEILRGLTGYTGEPDLKPLRAGEVDRIYLSAARAGEHLDWRAEVSLEEGLSQVVDYMRQEAKGK